jgi:hypothetical protein
VADDDDIDAAFGAFARDVEETVIEFVTEIVALLQETTPFLTGHARANWVPSIGRPYITVTDQQGRRDTRGRFTRSGAQASGLAEIVSYKLSQGDVFITNNVPYINRLNSGHSTQAPAGFIEDCVATAIARVSARGSE